MVSPRYIVQQQRETTSGREEFLDWTRPKCTSCDKRPDGNRDHGGRCVACRFRLLRDGGGLCPTCGKIDAASAFLESAHVVRQCLDCEQRGYHIPSDHEVHLREIMTSDVLCTAGNSRIARQRIGEIQHVRTFQKEFSDFPTGSVTSNHDPNTTPDCIVHADEGDVAVEVTELLLPEAGQAHENAVQVAQRPRARITSVFSSHGFDGVVPFGQGAVGCDA